MLQPSFRTLGYALPLLAALTLPLFDSAARAQSNDEFENGFDEDFEDARRTRTAPTPTPVRRAARPTRLPTRATTDEFAEDDSAEASTTPATPATTAAPANADESASSEAVASTQQAANDENTADGAWRARRMHLGSTWNGSIGGIHVLDAGSTASATFRAQLLTNFFFANSFLEAGDSNTHIGGAVSLAWAPWDFLEIYGAIMSYANSNTRSNPSLFQVLGDSTVGVKAFYRAVPWFTVGGDLQATLLNSVGGIGLSQTNFGIRLNGTADLRELENGVPFIARLNVQYMFDNSASLVSEVEQARYRGVASPRPYRDEERNLVTRIERFALNINRTDFFNLGIGFEAPFDVGSDVRISPMLEWTLGIPVNRQGYSCLFIPTTPGGSTPSGDGCLERQGFNAFPSTLTIGVRVQPALRGLQLTAALDIGTSGMSTFVRELSGNAPYNVILGLSYGYDTTPPAATVVREVERRVEVPAQLPPHGHIRGTVVEQGTTTVIAGAIISFPTQELLSSQVTDAQGRFVSYELPPGEIVMNITHGEYQAGECRGTIAEEGGDVDVQCTLVAGPRMGEVRGTVVSDAGAPVTGASITITGPTSATLSSDVSGAFNRAELAPGTYTARIDADGFLIGQDTFAVVSRQTATPRFTIIARPRRGLVTLRAREIVIRRQVNFATDSAEIQPDSASLLTEIADVLLRHPDITQVEIQGHTDDRGGVERNQDLSQRRAESVRTWLVGAGVQPERLTAAGYGQTRQLVPNITAGNRARNRRVQFMIQSRTE